MNSPGAVLSFLIWLLAGGFVTMCAALAVYVASGRDGTP